ncbi:MAG: hypothetical protein ACRDHI_09735 [Actinomycetota bacterium]
MTEPSRGVDALRQLATELDVSDIRRTLAGFDRTGSSDRSWRVFLDATGGAPNLGERSQRQELARLLRSWGCRHLRRADDAMTTEALSSWWREGRELMPPAARPLVDLDDTDLRDAARAFDGLATRPAAHRMTPTSARIVTFGSTAAAKAMFMVRPLAFPPWDAAIALGFGRRRPTGADYAAYVEACAQTLRHVSARVGVAVDDLPAELGRPSSTPAKIVDEFLWLRLTRG